MLLPIAIREHLRPIQDPELGFSIIDLGLVYDITVNDTGDVTILMTFTTPTCPLTDYFRHAITQQVRQLPGSRNIEVQFTLDPPWSIAKATNDVRAELALRGISTVQW
jgi:metal-sulfur cluster biosynthetic enzyme